MRIFLSTAAALAAALSIGAGGAAAQTADQRLAAGLLVGTNGIGGELKFRAAGNVVLRGSVEGFGLSRDVTYDDIDFQGKLKLFTGGVFIDLHPSSTSPLFLSGGAYTGKRRVSIDAQPASPVDIGDVTYTPAQVGTLRGAVEMSKFTPFLGVGIDSTFTSSSGWGFKSIIGVAFSGRPDVALTSTGGALSGNPAFLAQLERERAQISDDAQVFKYYPVISIGLSRRF